MAMMDDASRASLIAHRALLGGLRRELSLEALEQALELEADGTLAALCHCTLAANSEDPTRALAELDSAVSRAPSHPQPRWLRLEQSLRAGAWQKALVDAQQLEALAAAGPARARSLHRVGRSFLAHGQLREAVMCLRRALTSNPDEAGILLDLARALEGSGEGLRAAELYQMALARAESSDGARVAADLDVDAARLALERAAMLSGHAHHVAERREDGAVLFGDRQPIVEPSHRQYTHGASRAVNQLDVRRQEIGEREPVDRVGMAAAHLHDAVVAIMAGERADLGGGLLNQHRIPEFVHEPHWGSPKR
jgi:hypothetical protein